MVLFVEFFHYPLFQNLSLTRPESLRLKQFMTRSHHIIIPLPFSGYQINRPLLETDGVKEIRWIIRTPDLQLESLEFHLPNQPKRSILLEHLVRKSFD